ALEDLSFNIGRGEVLGVAGPNGAGKSTLMNVCTGGLHATAGQVRFNGENITGLNRHKHCGLGIAQTFQIPTLISSLTVGENLVAGQIFGTEARGTNPSTSIEDILQLTDLDDSKNTNASNADLLTRKRIMLGAALATEPQIIFMDEPFAGLNPTEIAAFLDLIRHVHEQLSITIVMVEHKTRALAEIADRILIINFGKFVMLDEPEVVLNDDHVVEIYLGKKHSA
ncbi:MAG: ATP-binding cassette domain-containing protein, partial [Pseudomonadota bacterium]